VAWEAASFAAADLDLAVASYAFDAEGAGLDGQRPWPSTPDFRLLINPRGVCSRGPYRVRSRTMTFVCL
jgi:hypothetical protein